MQTFAEYEEAALSTAIYPGQGTALGLMYVALKGAGEAGEFAEHVGKAIRDDGFGIPKTHSYVREKGTPGELRLTVFRGLSDNLSDDRRDKLCKEIGDQLWYLAAKARELGTTLEKIAAENIAKLQSRKDRGMLGGSGDNR